MSGMRAIPWAENTCTICAETSVCTPSNDFYGAGGIVPDGQLACERCFSRLVREHMNRPAS